MTIVWLVLLMSVSLAVFSFMSRPAEVRAAILLTPDDGDGTGNDDTTVGSKLPAELLDGTKVAVDGNDGTATTDDGTANTEEGVSRDGATVNDGTTTDDGILPNDTTTDDGTGADDGGIPFDGTGSVDGNIGDGDGMIDGDIDSDGVHVIFVDSAIDEQSNHTSIEDSMLDLGRMSVEDMTIDDVMAFVCDGVPSPDCANVPPLR